MRYISEPADHQRKDEVRVVQRPDAQDTPDVKIFDADRLLPVFSQQQVGDQKTAQGEKNCHAEIGKVNTLGVAVRQRTDQVWVQVEPVQVNRDVRQHHGQGCDSTYAVKAREKNRLAAFVHFGVELSSVTSQISCQTTATVHLRHADDDFERAGTR